ncbi:hypothetical protein [Hymenobacter pini]|uniref:hypothetical protein n=1 Tax=Hymenobacter pini TaxID=2880879 RepID=UPI001CF3F5D0|nr:hypothetical protein [Hymenobacter pini]MCA8830569.1 hypothetical protein [Hymenobacter pini]
MALLLDLPRERMKRILKSRAKPSVTLLARVRRALPYVNPDWLLTGEGPVLLTTPPADPLYHLLPVAPIAPSNAIHTNNGVAHQTLNVLHCQQDLHVCRQHVGMLLQQLQDKEKIIQLLENQLNQTNTH